MHGDKTSTDIVRRLGRHGRRRAVVAAIVGGALLVSSNVVGAPPALADQSGTYMGTAQDDPRFTTASDPARLSNAFDITGTLRDDNGAAVANRKLSISLDPSPAMLLASESDEDAAVGLELGGTQTDASGRFTLHLPALKGVDRYLDEDGLATLLFMSFGDNKDMMFRQYVRLPNQAQQTATPPVADENVKGDPTDPTDPADPVIKPPKGSIPIDRPDKAPAESPDEASKPDGAVFDYTDPQSSPQSAAAEPVSPLTEITLTAPTSPLGTAPATDKHDNDGVASADGEATSSAAAAAQGVSIGKECTRAWGNIPWANYRWKKVGKPVRTWVPVQRAHTGSKTKMKYEWGNTKETFMETTVEYAYKSVGVKGGFSKSVVSGSGVNFNIDNQVIRDLDVEYDFYHYSLDCQMSGNATKWKATGVRELRPYVFKGFNRSNNYTGYYTCPKAKWRGALAHELWVSRNTTHTQSISGNGKADADGLSAGVSVSAKQVNTGMHKKTFIPTKSGARLCGQDNNPTKTDKVAEYS